MGNPPLAETWQMAKRRGELKTEQWDWHERDFVSIKVFHFYFSIYCIEYPRWGIGYTQWRAVRVDSAHPCNNTIKLHSQWFWWFLCSKSKNFAKIASKTSGKAPGYACPSIQIIDLRDRLWIQSLSMDKVSISFAALPNIIRCIETISYFAHAYCLNLLCG